MTIAGGAGTGKTSLARALAGTLSAAGTPALAVSSGAIYRALGFLATKYHHIFDCADAEAMPAARLVGLAEAYDVQFVNGRVYLDWFPLSEEVLNDPTVARLASQLGGTLEAHTYASELIRRQIEAFDGVVILDGRSVNYEFCGCAQFYLMVSPQMAAQRRGILAEDVQLRDQTDSAYTATGPLQRTPGEIELHNHGSLEDLVTRALSHLTMFHTGS